MSDPVRTFSDKIVGDKAADKPCDLSMIFNVRDLMKKPINIAAACIAVAVIVFVIVRQKTVLPPSVIGEQVAPELISDEAWRESIEEDPTAHGYSGYGILQGRGSDVAIAEGLRDLTSDDAYIWMNAASYLGSRGRSEAVPYLIKALRHTAWRADEERVQLLRSLTKQSFGNDFDAWRAWYEAQSARIEIDWTSSLGHAPRTETTKREQ